MIWKSDSQWLPFSLSVITHTDTHTHTQALTSSDTFHLSPVGVTRNMNDYLAAMFHLCKPTNATATQQAQLQGEIKHRPACYSPVGVKGACHWCISGAPDWHKTQEWVGSQNTFRPRALGSGSSKNDLVRHILHFKWVMSVVARLIWVYIQFCVIRWSVVDWEAVLSMHVWQSHTTDLNKTDSQILY